MPVLNIKSQYNFIPIATAVLGNGYKATLMAVMDYDTAMSVQPDLVAVHAAVFAYTAPGTSQDPTQLEYYKIKTEFGDIRIIAKQWLASEPTLVNNGTLTAVISGVSSAQKQLLIDIINANFTQDFQVTFVAS